MIVGQYVLGIKVPGRSNSVIFMISGRRRAAQEGRARRRLVNPRRQESSPSFALKRGPPALPSYAQIRRRIVINAIVYSNGSIHIKVDAFSVAIYYALNIEILHCDERKGNYKYYIFKAQK